MYEYGYDYVLGLGLYDLVLDETLLVLDSRIVWSWSS
jgi:hypothetical protein